MVEGGGVGGSVVEGEGVGGSVVEGGGVDCSVVFSEVVLGGGVVGGVGVEEGGSVVELGLITVVLGLKVVMSEVVVGISVVVVGVITFSFKPPSHWACFWLSVQPVVPVTETVVWALALWRRRDRSRAALIPGLDGWLAGFWPGWLLPGLLAWLATGLASWLLARLLIWLATGLVTDLA